MKELVAPRLKNSVGSATEALVALDAQNIPFQVIDSVNWPDEYPYKPDVRFRIAHTGKAVVLNYRVKEISVRAVAKSDNDSVWEDSCVEFFIKKVDEDIYYNVECNCAARLLIARGKDRSERQTMSPHKFESIERLATLGNNTFEEKAAPEEWEVVLLIPADLLGLEKLRGISCLANFYKCGDLLETPHFLSWNPINTPAPDFHRPEFFGKLIFE